MEITVTENNVGIVAAATPGSESAPGWMEWLEKSQLAVSVAGQFLFRGESLNSQK